MQKKIEELQPVDLNDEIWDDLLTVVFEQYPSSLKKQIKEINQQVASFYLVRDIELSWSSYELIELKEYAHDLYPGNYYQQLSYIYDEMFKLALEKATEPNVEEKNNSKNCFVNIPEDIKKIIKANAYEAYFDDKVMFDIYTLEQIDAYNDIREYQMDGVPAWVIEAIVFYTATKYFGDYSGQFRELKQHVQSFIEIESLQLPQGSKIKQTMREDLPGNYNDQLKSIVRLL